MIIAVVVSGALVPAVCQTGTISMTYFRKVATLTLAPIPRRGHRVPMLRLASAAAILVANIGSHVFHLIGRPLPAIR